MRLLRRLMPPFSLLSSASRSSSAQGREPSGELDTPSKIDRDRLVERAREFKQKNDGTFRRLARE